MLSDEQLYAAYYSRIENDDQDPILGLRAVAEGAVKAEREGAVPVCGVIVLPGAEESWPQFYDEKGRLFALPAGDHKLYTHSPQSSATVPEDELLGAARHLAHQYGKSGHSELQRRLNIGFNRASRLVNALVSEGLVRPEPPFELVALKTQEPDLGPFGACANCGAIGDCLCAASQPDADKAQAVAS